MYVLGLNAGSATSHDPAACLVDGDGRVLAFIEEERLTRKRHGLAQQPVRSIEACLRMAGITAADVDVVVVGWDEPRMAARAGRPWGFDSAREFLAGVGLIDADNHHGPARLPDLQFVSHHRAHAVSTFYASPYQEAAVLVVDGNGEDESISIFRASRGQQPVRLVSWPRVYSLGYLYEETTKWLGMSAVLHAGKTMGLAAYGRCGAPAGPSWLWIADGRLNSMLGVDPVLDYGEIRAGWRGELGRWAGAPRAETPIPELAGDPAAVRLAWASQSIIETVMGWLAGQARELTGLPALCMAGGVALNCAANGRLPGPVYVPPVPNDTGVALGAAWSVAPPTRIEPFVPYTGGEPGTLSVIPEHVRRTELDVDRVAELIAAGSIGAVCRGRSEVGPRALCHRSILASPKREDMRDRVNARKDRERWRPFGPVSNVDNDLWRPVGDLERYMVGAAQVTEAGRAAIPAVVHADGTTRPQRLDPTAEPFVDALLTRLADGDHPPALLNTSFNGPGEPLVETADDALACARRQGLDFLVLNDELLTFDS